MHSSRRNLFTQDFSHKGGQCVDGSTEVQSHQAAQAREISSAVERTVHIGDVTGSIPVSPTTIQHDYLDHKINYNTLREQRRLGLPYLTHERNRHGTMVWYVRVNGVRFRFRAEYGTVEFMRQYAAALSELLGPPQTLPNREQTKERAKRATKSPGVVYFVRDGDFVKIGYSVDVLARIKTLQTSTTRELRLIHYVPGRQSDEAAFHRRFKEYRRQGEWFVLAGELAEFLSEYDPWIKVIQMLPRPKP